MATVAASIRWVTDGELVEQVRAGNAAAGDLTQEEIAAAMNIPAATFRGRVRDARLRLKEKLNQT